MRKECVWRKISTDEWRSSCGNDYLLFDELPARIGWKFCPFCGLPLREVTPFKEER